MKRRKYYPNNWDAIKQCPPNYFPPMAYEEFRDWKVFGYQLPSSHYSIIRVEDLQKNTITEYTYKTEHHTKQRMLKEVSGHKRVTLATMDGVYHLIPNPLDFNNDQKNI